MTTLSVGWKTRPIWKTFVSQVLFLTEANIKTRYRKTWAGFIWVVSSPLIMYGCQTFIFSRVLKLNVHNYEMYLLSGLLPWLYIVQSMEMSSAMFVVHGTLLKSFPAHPLVYLLSQLLDNFFNFVAAFLILFSFVILNYPPTLSMLLLPIPMVLLMIFVFAFSWILAVNHVFYRDTRFLVSFVLNFTFFLTPIFYTIPMVPEEYRWVVEFNPFHIMIRPFRVVLYNFEWSLFFAYTFESLLLTAFLLGVASFYWKKRKNEIYFRV